MDCKTPLDHPRGLKPEIQVKHPKAGAQMSEEILAQVEASPFRRYFALAVIWLLGFMLIFLGVNLNEGGVVWQALIALIGVIVLMFSERFRRSTLVSIILTKDGLFQTDGRVVALVGDISSVERGAFAVKPSNGFTFRTREKLGSVWVPGIWWRAGKRVGVGGVISGAQTKFMADMLSAMLQEQV